MKNDELKNVPAADAGLDEALAQMAEEVPPMPADFHDRWMSAVRAEAEKEKTETEEKPRDKTGVLVRWTRILSAAAAFVFLIGGTLLYRSTKKSLSDPENAIKQGTVIAAETAEEAAVYEAADEAPAVAAEPVLYAAVQADAGDADAVENSMMAGGAALNLFAAAPREAASEKTAAAASADYAANAAEDAAEYESEAYEAEAFMEEADEAPEIPEPTAAPTEAPESASGPEPTPGFLQQAGAFFTDMGDFLLAALPYLLVLAVPAAAALVLRRKKAGRQ